MSRRKCTGDQEFGSDSFLDIIANIVGILIILIVMAGVKVARQPANATDSLVEVIATETSESPMPAFADVDGTLLNEEGDNAGAGMSTKIVDTDMSLNDDSLQEAIDSLTEPEVVADEVADLERQIAALTIQLDETRSSTDTTEKELANLLALIQRHEESQNLQQKRAGSIAQERDEVTHSLLSLQASLSDMDRRATSFKSTVASLSDRQAYIVSALQQVTAETQRLTEVLETAEASLPNTDRLNHRLSPVGEAVADEELHFRLHGGRIAHVPLNGLLQRMTEQVMNRRSMVMRFHRYEGMVGPVGGFQMKYIVQRGPLPPLRALQMGESAGISVARWSIIPADTLTAEPVDSALRIGSRFRQVLEATNPDTTITVWLYPDDFQYFSRLRELAHSLNLRVAARPLPEGTDIAGSPNGSRSTAQ